VLAGFVGCVSGRRVWLLLNFYQDFTTEKNKNGKERVKFRVLYQALTTNHPAGGKEKCNVNFFGRTELG